MHKITSAIKYWIQRRTRGYDDTTTWNLDYEIVKFFNTRYKLYYKLASPIIKLDDEYEKYQYKNYSWTLEGLIKLMITTTDKILNLYDKVNDIDYDYQETKKMCKELKKLIKQMYEIANLTHIRMNW